MTGSVIVGTARTPIGKLSGAFAGLSAMELGGIAIKSALERAGIGAEQIDYVLMGQVLQAGAGQITARQAAANAGIPMTVPAMTLNKVCLSGINAVYLADQMIRNGDAEVVVAGGMESMTNAPYLLPGARAGYRMGNNEVVDSMINDGLWCAFDAVHMGAGTENYVGQVGNITREAQDEAAAKSHERAAAAQKEGRFADEITPVSIKQRKGDPVVVDTDEGVRPGTTPESLAALRPAFSKDGTITAGNASQISDGGAAIIVTSRAKAEELGVTPLAELIGYGMVAGPDTSLLHQPSRAIKRALEANDMTTKDVDLFELNEAFAAVGIASMKDLGINDDIVNVNGGAIALGHPVGMSGARVVLTIINELRRRGGGVGAAALCGGGGQGDAAIVRTL
ncbi:MAG: acetyl-CoA acetyltransferase [Actinomycetia bacterium]|jgi:acetyl-CoA C-acetyltransferase|nr:acetyl-CoA acetyltransferase [Actinomycetes bacterium]MDQ1460291.1 acetyl-CoA C-acetyltransferase [Actinomycetota bacterium]